MNGTELESKSPTCIIVGASHAGVNAAFFLRNEGWTGKILLIDTDKNLPYHKPPLSKKALTCAASEQNAYLKPESSYAAANIELLMSAQVTSLNASTGKLNVVDQNGNYTFEYDKLILATGARAFIPPIKGLSESPGIFTMRNMDDVNSIKNYIAEKNVKNAAIIGGGYIGLETAASLKGLGLDVTVIEREERLLARVTAPVMSEFFQKLHEQKGVKILTNQEVMSVSHDGERLRLICTNGTSIETDMIIVGVGIKVNSELALEAGLDLDKDNAISVDEYNRTSSKNIYAIGDCAHFKHQMFEQKIRLESVQNAVDQARLVAKNICGQSVVNTAVPWFWSDQYDYKLQMVGLSIGHTELVVRHEPEVEDSDLTSFSVWYFKGDTLLSVDAVNNTKAYVIGTKAIQAAKSINRDSLINTSEPLSPKTIFC